MLDKKTEWIGWFVAFMIVSNSTTLMPFSWGIGYYIVLLLAFFFILTMRGLQIGMSMLVLYVLCMISIIGNEVPAFFHAWPRWGTFALVTTVVSFTLCSESAVAFRVRMFASVSKLLVVVTLLSFFTLLLGTGYGLHDSWFQGVTSHSMIMGPVAAMSNLCCLYQLQYKQKHKYMRWGYYILIISGFICIMQTGSRSSLIGAVVSFLCFMYYLNQDEFYLLIKRYMLLVLLLIVSAPVWWAYTDKIAEKNRGQSGLNTDSREALWQQRIEEWKSSPFIGIGFGTVDTEAMEGGSFDVQNGRVETGNSWLCTLSMTGILGFGCVVVIFLGAYLKLLRMMALSRPVGSYLMAIMSFFIFHMMAEGYIFACGSFLSIQVWLLLGVIYGIAFCPQYATSLEYILQFNWTRGEQYTL